MLKQDRGFLERILPDVIELVERVWWRNIMGNGENKEVFERGECMFR